MKHLILLIGLLMSLPIFSQTENDLWMKTDTVSTDLYEFQVPSAWRNFGKMIAGGQGPEQFFEASGQGLPISFNGGPVKVSIFLVKLDKKKNLEKAKEICGDFSFDLAMLQDQGEIRVEREEYRPVICFESTEEKLMYNSDDVFQLHDYAFGNTDEAFGD